MLQKPKDQWKFFLIFIDFMSGKNRTHPNDFTPNELKSLQRDYKILTPNLEQMRLL